MQRRNFIVNGLQLAALGAAPTVAESALANSAPSRGSAKPASSPQPGTPSGIVYPNRPRLSLDGDWAFEPLCHTLLQPDDSFKEDNSNLPKPGAMPVPSNWHLSGLPDFHGRVAFRRAFTATPDLLNAPVWLCLAAVDYFCEVRLNGASLGHHEGFFEPFEFELTGLLRSGQNQLEVIVDAPRELPGIMFPGAKRQIKGIFNMWLPLDRQMEPTGGITGSVYLERRPLAQIRAVRYSTKIVPAIPAAAPLEVGTSPSGYAAAKRRAQVLVEVEYFLREAGPAALDLVVGPARWQGSVAGQSGHNIHRAILTVEEPLLWYTWDFGRPHLYDASAMLTCGSDSDRCEFQAGLRDIQFDPAKGEWHLNGERFFLRGSSVIPSKWLAGYTSSQIAADIDLLRKANINGVRVCVHVTRDQFYAACDRAGILVWQDFPLQWQYKADNAFVAEASRQLQAMLRHLFNHPSIGLYTCQNEPDPPNRQGMDPTLSTVARAADPSRFIFEACDYSQHTYPGWYGDSIKDFETIPAAPVVSEFGAQALLSANEMRDLLGAAVWPPSDKWLDKGFENRSTFTVAGIHRGNSLDEFIANSQAYQCRLIQFAIEHYRRAKYTKLGGFFHFMFMDGWQTIGWSVLSYKRIPKPGYYALQRAMQPVLPVVDLVAPRFSNNLKENWAIASNAWLINDTRQPLERCRLVFELRGPSRPIPLRELTVDLAADSVRQLDIGLSLPRTVTALPPGSYKLAAAAYSASGALLGDNLYELTVVDAAAFDAPGA